METTIQNSSVRLSGRKPYYLTRLRSNLLALGYRVTWLGNSVLSAASQTGINIHFHEPQKGYVLVLWPNGKPYPVKCNFFAPTVDLLLIKLDKHRCLEVPSQMIFQLVRNSHSL